MVIRIDLLKRYSSVLSTVLIIFAGVIMIAHGLRMMTQGIFFPDSIYPAPVPSSIDFWFDWFMLSIVGFSIILIGAKRWRQWIHGQKMKKESKEYSQSVPT